MNLRFHFLHIRVILFLLLSSPVPTTLFYPGFPILLRWTVGGKSVGLFCHMDLHHFCGLPINPLQISPPQLLPPNLNTNPETLSLTLTLTLAVKS